MRRADRLFEIVQLIRGRRLSTAEWLANRLEVSVRTVYRDIADLQAQGVPIEGEAGVGYRMRAGFDLPPLMFTRQEAQALVASVRVAGQWLDATTAAHGESALSKILAVLPAAARAAAESLALYVPAIESRATERERLGIVQTAIERHQILDIIYVDLAEERSRRCVRPLCTAYWGAVWTMVSWCELRGDFRSFRLDRLERIEPLERRFVDEPGRTLADFRRGIDGDCTT